MVKVEVIWSNGDTSTYEVKEDDLHKFSDKTITVIPVYRNDGDMGFVNATLIRYWRTVEGTDIDISPILPQ